MGIKTAVHRGWTKAKIWVGNHKTELACGTAGAITLAGGYGLYRLYKTTQKSDEEKLNEAFVETLDAIQKDVEDHRPKWNEEEYRETYDKVTEFANSLTLKLGEGYYIEDRTQYYDTDWYKGPKDGTPSVSHMIDGWGVYPPDEEEGS